MNNLFKTTTLCIAAAAFLTATCPAVTSVITRHKSGDVLMKGTTDNTVIDSRGMIRLAPKTEKLSLEKELEEVWAIHTILADKTGTLYIGTSPQGKVIRVRDGKTDVLYPKAAEKKEQPAAGDPNILQQEPQPNEHVFAMAFDVAGRVLAGVSGDKGKLLRISSGTEILFENEKVRYIFAIALDKQNNIYLGTGPNGQLWGLDAFGQNPRLICTLEDKNILSLSVGENGVLYAGTDTRGVIYKIDSKTGKVNVLFDSGQDEITSLVLGSDGKLFAAASSADAAGQPFQVVARDRRVAPTHLRKERRQKQAARVSKRPIPTNKKHLHRRCPNRHLNYRCPNPSGRCIKSPAKVLWNRFLKKKPFFIRCLKKAENFFWAPARRPNYFR
jgi:outer membrane protein assembly factor BamB